MSCLPEAKKTADEEIAGRAIAIIRWRVALHADCIAITVGGRHVPRAVAPALIYVKLRLASRRQVVTVDHATPDWRGNVGVVPALLDRAAFDSDHSVAMLCGPEIMMRFTVNALHDRGLTPDRIYLSMERNMKCAVALCGHCQFGPSFVCRDGPVYRFDRIAPIFNLREI